MSISEIARRNLWPVLLTVQLALAPGTARSQDIPLPGFDRSVAGKPAPEVAFTDSLGVLHHLSDYRGKVLLVDFWASWCAPCVAELPSIAKLARDLGPKGLVVIAITHDKGGAAAGQAYLSRQHLDPLVAYADPSSTRLVAHAFGQRWLPTAIIIDENGREVAQAVGGMEWDMGSVREIFGR